MIYGRYCTHERKKFVKEALLQITNAVHEAKAESKIAIALDTISSEQRAIDIMEPQMVSFKLSVVVNKDVESGIEIFSVAKMNGGYTSQVANEIAFSVPIYFQAPKT